ncbi:unnamed protein product, partial [Hapterophycus canaliculatus]
PSTLRDLAAAERSALATFRHKSIASGETEWVPYVSQAQALVSTQLERLSAVVSSSSSPKAAVQGSQRPAGAGGARREQDAVKMTAAGTPPRRHVAGKAKSPLASDGGRGTGTECDDEADAGAAASAAAADAHEPSNERGNADASNGSNGGGSSAGNVDGVDASSAPAGGGPFKFFQSGDGQKVFLHPFDMRQLLDDAEKGLPLPERIDAKVLEVETVKLTPELRRRLPFLGHLPIHCDISFLEVDMGGFVSEETANKFREETQKRERKRRGRAAQEARVAKKEARLERDRADRIAAMRAFTVDLQ